MHYQCTDNGMAGQLTKKDILDSRLCNPGHFLFVIGGVQAVM